MVLHVQFICFFCFKQKTAYEMRISDWSSDVCSSDLAEQLKLWWKENWMALAAGLVIGLAAIFGWEGWQKHTTQRAATASQMYDELKQALADDKADVAKPLADKLVAD